MGTRSIHRCGHLLFWCSSACLLCLRRYEEMRGYKWLDWKVELN